MFFPSALKPPHLVTCGVRTFLRRDPVTRRGGAVAQAGRQQEDRAVARQSSPFLAGREELGARERRHEGAAKETQRAAIQEGSAVAQRSVLLFSLPAGRNRKRSGKTGTTWRDAERGRVTVQAKR
ncbi:hypothetical protein NDU88_001934 [Pleurodeles waltl]|uniref:Uncharacterized protein n=1 Tax=Pleurodeles waltl TaxID=8319 RepID=A0AAV7SE57_PLEWA|nr:hypothetical protein NDU88_001934 [Pleurodeles waltl]